MTPASTHLRLTPSLSPHGRLTVVVEDDAPVVEPAIGERIRAGFERGTGYGLLRLGGAEVCEALPPVFAYWRDFGSRFVTALCTRPDTEDPAGDLPAAPDDLAILAEAAPVMPGAEYLTAEVLRAFWSEMGEAFARERTRAKASREAFLKQLSPAWNVVGRVHFNLAENRKDEEAPFAFLATYTHALSQHGKAQHLPLGQALREYSGSANKEKLLSLLVPVQRAAEHCAWLRHMVEEGEIFHPLRWSPADACQMLGDVAELERAGVVVRMPANWRGGRPARPQVTATVGRKAPSVLGTDALLDFRAEVTLDGQSLTKAELREILGSVGGLAFIRGQWVEVDRQRIDRMLERFKEAERLAARGGLTFAESMRMLAGANVTDAGEIDSADLAWSGVVAGPWLAETLKGLRSPSELEKVDPGRELVGSLRPYQQVGVRWLHRLSRLGLGACLADDMGLGKTIQVLSLLLVLHRTRQDKRPSVLVAPASLLANWASEIERFAPALDFLIAHPSAMTADELKSIDERRLGATDLVITSYGTLLRCPWLPSTSWRLAILDEAQAIKNPGAKQTRAAKQLQAEARIALTGTPIENRLGDLWSIFDFINPGLLGSAKEFTRYTKRLGSSPASLATNHRGKAWKPSQGFHTSAIADEPKNPYGPLRGLVRPYILRRLKTDKSVIADLPDKTEVKAFCQLGRKQAALYQQAVDELAAQLDAVDGMKRRGTVLAALMRMKQICNHPSQWLGDGAWAEADSGKWMRLRDIGEVIAAKQEKALIFTQFRQLTEPLAAFLGDVFGRAGLVLHGETDVKKRKDLVRRFQDDESVPFFVLSLKAGGAGLNLTAASHVVHFDRWWNPAVENQATDRAFRIGQTQNVLVHKFICRGTVEEKIDALIESKKALTTDMLEGGAELNLTEMRDDELLRLVSLDLNRAMKE